MKKYYFYLVITVILLGMSGCAKKGSPKGAKYSIAVSVEGNNTFRLDWSDMFCKMAEERGFEVYLMNAESSAAKQLADVESMLVKQPDVCIISPYDSEGAVPAVEAVADAGIPCIVYDFIANTDRYDTLVYNGEEPAGKMAGEYLNQWLEEDGTRAANVGYLVGDYGMETAMPRFTEFLNSCPAVNLVAQAQANWSTNDALQIAEEWLQAYPEINVFVCMNDDMAIGVIQALNAAGKMDDPDILVIGFDGVAAALPYIYSGQMVTVSRNISSDIDVLLDISEKLIQRETVPKKIMDFSKKEMITQENIIEYAKMTDCEEFLLEVSKGA